MKNKCKYLFLFIMLAISFIGCFREVVRDTSSLKDSSNVDINIVTKDSSLYCFNGGAYTISQDTANKQAIYGQAKKYRPNKERYTKFEGFIPLSDVDKIYSFETTPFLYITLGIVTLSVGLLILMVSAFSHIGTGG